MQHSLHQSGALLLLPRFPAQKFQFSFKSILNTNYPKYTDTSCYVKHATGHRRIHSRLLRRNAMIRYVFCRLRGISGFLAPIINV